MSQNVKNDELLNEITQAAFEFAGGDEGADVLEQLKAEGLEVPVDRVM